MDMKQNYSIFFYLRFYKFGYFWLIWYIFTVISIGQVAQKSVQEGDPPVIFRSDCDITDMTI